MLQNTIRGLLADAEKTGYGPTISPPLASILLAIGAAVDGAALAAAAEPRVEITGRDTDSVRYVNSAPYKQYLEAIAEVQAAGTVAPVTSQSEVTAAVAAVAAGFADGTVPPASIEPPPVTVATAEGGNVTVSGGAEDKSVGVAAPAAAT